MSGPDELRLHRLRKRIRELTEVDRDCTVFGANAHDWRLADPLPAATIESAPMCAPFSSIAPMPIRQRSSMVQPCSTAECPTVTSSPMVVGCVSRITCTIVRSWMLLRRPMRMRWTSPRMTTFIHTDDSAPRCTSPITWADASTNAVVSTVGRVPL